MRHHLLATLLHYANADPPLFCQRTEFYALKERLLRRWGRLADYDLQEIRKECWGTRRWDPEHGDYEYLGCRDDCPRCGGTGIFHIRWIWLERWEWCGYVFHRPSRESFTRPDYQVSIHGRIEHPHYGWASSEAVLWLYLLCGEWRLLWRALRSSCSCGRYWWPLLNVQRVTMRLCMWLSWRRCFCGRLYPTWGSGWQVCRQCRRGPVELPF